VHAPNQLNVWYIARVDLDSRERPAAEITPRQNRVPATLNALNRKDGRQLSHVPKYGRAQRERSRTSAFNRAKLHAGAIS
jgi:hypothetical protein